MWCACVYNVDKRYGGQEEGGWYYSVGEPYPISPNGNNATDAAFFQTRAEAYRFIQNPIQQEAIKELNEGLPSIDSVNSQGRWEWQVTFGMPTSYPEERPHYE